MNNIKHKYVDLYIKVKIERDELLEEILENRFLNHDKMDDLLELNKYVKEIESIIEMEEE